VSNPASTAPEIGQTSGPETPGGVFRAIDRAIGYLVYGGMVASCLCVAVIILLGVADIVGGTFFKSPLMGTVEITETLLAMTIFLALGYALEQHQHIVVDILTASLLPPWKLALHTVALVSMLAVLLLLSWQSFLSAQRAVQAMEVAAGYLRVPIWLAKSLSAAGLWIATLEAIRQLAWLIFKRDLAAGRRRAPRLSEAEEIPGEI
jgi:TRAP-type C4-dicarboxylate transport system permease small subunit